MSEPIAVPLWVFLIMQTLSILVLGGAILWTGPRIKRWIEKRGGDT